MNRKRTSIGGRSPWLNQDENTVNILVVPIPYKVSAGDFKVVDEDCLENEYDVGRSRYFEFSPSAAVDPESIKTLIINANKECKRVHILVFPETSLTGEDLDDLKTHLINNLPAHEIPLIVSGIRGKSKHSGLPINQVELSIFFAGKWYSLRQSKHHRWKINRSQIQQYSLSASLSPAYDWWEGIEVPHRLLNFLCPDGWLTLCPLICEESGTDSSPFRE